MVNMFWRIAAPSSEVDANVNDINVEGITLNGINTIFLIDFYLTLIYDILIIPLF